MKGFKEYQAEVIKLVDEIQKAKMDTKSKQDLIYGLRQELQRLELNVVLLNQLIADAATKGIKVTIDKNKFPKLAGSDCPMHVAEALDLID